ncbi:MAG: outer membrane protein transport protein [Myxococcota bacterium]|nr:outer membrane protein transport protein [Myxococcota bacterium]
MNHRNRIAGLTTLALLTTVPATGWAAGFQNMSQSATANGMASMGTANPDEPNASFYNAAALAQREGFEIYIGDTILIPETTYEPLDGNGEAAQTISQIFPPPNAHVGMAIDLGSAGTLGVAAGLTLPYGAGIAWPEDWDGDYIIISQDLQTYNFNPNVSYKLPGKDLSFGAGAQIYRTNVRLVRDAILRDDTQVRSEITGSGWGFGGTAAVLYRPIKPLSIGLNYRSAVDLDIEGHAHFEGEENTAFERTFTDQAGSTVIPIPHALTLGVGYTYEKLFVGLDINYTTWSRYDQIVLEFSEPCREGSESCDPEVDATDPPPSTIESKWEDAIAFRLGLQYEAVENLKIRAGFAYDNTPIPEKTLSPSLPGNDRAIVSLGLGYSIAGVRADVGYQFVNALEREVVDTNNLPGIYKTKAHVIGINLGYGY